MTERPRTIELAQDLAFQRREWSLQRIGWWALAAFVALAFLGLFGGGPLSRARAGDAGDPFWVEYERFVRIGAPTRLYVHGRSAGAAGFRIRVSRRYFEGLRIERVTPEPALIEIGSADVSMRFDSETPGTEPLTVIFDVQPLHAGRNAAELSQNGVRVGFTQFAYF